VKYVILIYGNPHGREIFESMSDAERREGLARYAALRADMIAAGEYVVSEALAEPAQGKRVSVVDGRPVASDGPFAEAKEHLAGFFLVDCASREQAMEYAARVPEAALGLVEVRPVVDLSVFEKGGSPS
jgi:hypothetical protein